MTRYALNRWDTAADAASIQSAATAFQGSAEHARPDRRGRHVADLPLPGAGARGGAAMTKPMPTTRGILIQTSKTQAKYSRRAILKRLGIGAGFLPLLSTERARAAAPSGYPTRFIAITWTDGICPPNFYPTGAAGALPATLPSILHAAAALELEAAAVPARDQAAEPDRHQRHDRRRLEVRRPLHLSGDAHGRRQLAQRHRRGPDHQRDLPVDRSDLRRQPARPRAWRTRSSTSAAAPTRATPATARAGRPTRSRTIPTSCSPACSAARA